MELTRIQPADLHGRLAQQQRDGDAGGIRDERGQVRDHGRGLLFPASPAFSADGQFLYVSNIALYLPFAGVQEPAIDSPWTLEVKHYTIAKIRAEIPPLTDQNER